MTQTQIDVHDRAYSGSNNRSKTETVSAPLNLDMAAGAFRSSMTWLLMLVAIGAQGGPGGLWLGGNSKPWCPEKNIHQGMGNGLDDFVGLEMYNACMMSGVHSSDETYRCEMISWRENFEPNAATCSGHPCHLRCLDRDNYFQRNSGNIDTHEIREVQSDANPMFAHCRGQVRHAFLVIGMTCFSAIVAMSTDGTICKG